MWGEKLYHQTDAAFGLDEGVGVGHYYGIDLLAGDRGVIQALVELALVDFTGDLLRLHAVAGAGEEVDNGFFEFHIR